MTATSALTQFTWHPQPAPAKFVAGLVESFQRDSEKLSQLAARMKRDTGTRLADWVDHFQLPRSAELAHQLVGLGYVEGHNSEWRIEAGMFPPIRLTDSGPRRIFIKVDSVVDFALANGFSNDRIRSVPAASIRTIPFAVTSEVECLAIERHGDPSLETENSGNSVGYQLARHYEDLLLRSRRGGSDADAFDLARILIRLVAGNIGGMPRACDLFFPRRARVLAVPQSRRADSEDAPRRARPRLGQSRPPHLSLQS